MLIGCCLQIDLRAVTGEQAVLLGADKFNSGSGAEIRTADTDDNENIARRADFFSRFFDLCSSSTATGSSR